MQDGAEKLKAAYNRIAEDWHREHQSDTWWVEGTGAFVSLLPPKGTVLDVGCGSGVKARFLLERGLSVRGIDFSEAMIAIAKREIPKGDFQALDIRDLDRIPETFDGVFAQAVLLHIPKKDVFDAIRRLGAKVRPGGHLYIAVKEIKPDQAEEDMKREETYGYPYERFFSYYTLPELTSYLEKAGMSTVYASTTPSGRTRWIQVISKKS